MKPSKPRIGIKWSLFGSFLVFSAAMLLLLWLFQIVFLDNFYRNIKTAAIKSTAETIISNIDNSEIAALIKRLAQDNEICIRIVDKSGVELYGAHVLPDCVIDHILRADQLANYYLQAKNSGGSYLEYFDRETFKDQVFDPKKFTGIGIPMLDRDMNTSLVYARTAQTAGGTDVVILLNAVLTPVSSTVQTLRVQLLYVTAILLGLSLVLALIISRRIARPIVRINNSSKELAQGNYEVKFEASGYKEIAGLADTLNHAAQELNKVEQLRRELIANVSHDLRTPLTMISGYAEVMRDLPGENNPENVQVIIDESRRLTGLVNDLLDLSRLQAGSQHLKLVDYNLTESIRKILQRYCRLIDQEGYKLSFEAGGDVHVTADEMRIDQVLYNLINNAINYTGDDKQVTVRQTVERGQVLVEVIDSGEGIPADQLPHIWDRYYKVDKTHRRAAVGTGLGLSIVKGALDLHHATYGVDSTPALGSVFWFRLPLAGGEQGQQSGS